MSWFLPYLIAVSAMGLVLTVYDKWASRHRKKRRVAELTLFLWAVFGASLAMYMTMLLIRHKTNHKRFMLGLPLLLVAQGFALSQLFSYL